MLIGLGVITTAVIAISALMLRSVTRVRAVGDEYIATYLASEGIELVKSIVETNFRSPPPGVAFNGGVPEDRCASGSEMDYDDWEITTFGMPGAPPCSEPNQPLLFDGATGRYSYDSGIPTRFRRALHISYDNLADPKAILVRSRVFWGDRSGPREVVLEDVFYDLCDVRCVNR